MLHTLDTKAALRILPLALGAALLAYFAVDSEGSSGLLFVAGATASAGLLVAWTRSAAKASDLDLLARLGTIALLLLPGALTAWLAFNSGGFFPERVAAGALIVIGALVVWTTIASDPFRGFGRPLAIAGGALALYAVWTLLSSSWSDAPARALIEFDRALLYLSRAPAFGSIGREPGAPAVCRPRAGGRHRLRLRRGAHLARRARPARGEPACSTTA